MKKKLLIFIFIMTILPMAAPLFAQNRIIDNAGLMNADEKAVFETRIAELASGYNFDLMILTEKSIGGKDPIDYSWNYLNSKGINGEEWDGCLLLLVTGSVVGDRDYVFTASGRGTKILNPTAYDRLESKVRSYLINNDFAGAYNCYISIWEEYLILESRGLSYNFFTQYNIILVLIGWIISLLIGLLTVRKWKADMNTALPRNEADTYIVPGTLNFTLKQDRFLYSTVTKTRRQQPSSSSGGGFSRSGGGRSSRSGKF